MSDALISARSAHVIVRQWHVDRCGQGGVREQGRADGLGGGSERSVADLLAVVRVGGRSDAGPTVISSLLAR